jgi:alpha-glucosidase (family GH31 glycosyl hydrolase)
MSKAQTSIDHANAAIEKATSNRETAIASAFLIFQCYKPLLAEALLESLRDERKAARWMCLHQRVFNGKNAYQILAEGDDDLVWDEMARSIASDFGFVAAK